MTRGNLRHVGSGLAPLIDLSGLPSMLLSGELGPESEQHDAGGDLGLSMRRPMSNICDVALSFSPLSESPHHFGPNSLAARDPPLDSILESTSLFLSAFTDWTSDTVVVTWLLNTLRVLLQSADVAQSKSDSPTTAYSCLPAALVELVQSSKSTSGLLSSQVCLPSPAPTKRAADPTVRGRRKRCKTRDSNWVAPVSPLVLLAPGQVGHSQDGDPSELVSVEVEKVPLILPEAFACDSPIALVALVASGMWKPFALSKRLSKTHCSAPVEAGWLAYFEAVRLGLGNWGIWVSMKSTSKGWRNFVELMHACGVLDNKFGDKKADLIWFIRGLSWRIMSLP